MAYKVLILIDWYLVHFNIVQSNLMPLKIVFQMCPVVRIPPKTRHGTALTHFYKRVMGE